MHQSECKEVGMKIMYEDGLTRTNRQFAFSFSSALARHGSVIIVN